jgi:predicted ATPase/transcriptional regulator with XRE-family HTH domain
VAESLAELLRSFRSAARLSQELLAERAGLSSRTVSDIETGFARSPRLVTLMLLAEALGLSDADRTLLQAAARRRGAAPAGSAATAPPVLRTVPLIGRDDDLAALQRLTAAGGARVVTLVGPAGVGKTSLALRVAADAAPAFALGATLVELAALDDPALVPAAVARGLNIPDGGVAGASDAVAAHVRDRSWLLLLDNVEHLLPAAAWVGELLAACPNVRVLATGREALRLRAETVYAVRPLRPDDAAALFVDRAKIVKPSFAVSAATQEAVARIVERLDNLPLAIELAAPRLLLLPAKALAARLERRLPLLSDGPVDAPQRQQTMHGAIAWSYDLLSGAEQTLFRKLGVFAGGASLEAAREVAGEADDDVHGFLLRIAGLVERSLLSLEEDADGEPRITMLEMLREYALEQLDTSGELAAVRRRHAAIMVEFARDVERAYVGKAQAQSVARLERERANVRAALAWAYEQRDIETGISLCASTWRIWWLRGRFAEAIEWMRRFADLAAAASPAGEPAEHAKFMRGLIAMLSSAGNLAEARARCEDAIAAARASGEDASLAAFLTSLGIAEQFVGAFDAAAAAHEEALAIRRRLDDTSGIATSLSNLSSVALTRGDLDAAATFAVESAALYRRIDHGAGLWHPLNKLGLIAGLRGEYDSAEALFGECLRIQSDLGDTNGMLYSYANLGGIAYKRGAIGQALELLRNSLDLAGSNDSKAALAKTFEDIGAAIGTFDPARGVRLVAAGDAVRQAIGSPLFPSERSDYDMEIAKLRDALGNDAFDTQWRIGSIMPLERALEEARANDGERDAAVAT